MTPLSHRFSTFSLPWIFAIYAVTACSNPDSTSTSTGSGGVSALACPGELPPGSDSFLTESLATGFTILRSNSKHKTTGPDGTRCCQVEEVSSTHECGRP